MFDEELRERLAEWVRPITGLPVPDIRVLRRRARRRRMRRMATGTTMTAVAAVAVLGITASLPSGRSAGGRPEGSASSASSWGPAPGTWNHGAWQPAGPSLAADASPADAPYIVIPWDRGGGLQVRNVFAGQAVAFVPALPGQYIGAVAGAGDDRTFVVQALVGGQTGGGPPAGFTTVAFDELRLRADGQPESLKLLFSIPMRDSLFFAISQDARMLAYTTDNDSGFETISLAAATGRSWPAVDAGSVAPPSLSWAGDRTLAFEWAPADNRHPPGIGIRVLDVSAAGNLLQASRLVVAYSRYCAAAAQGGWGCNDDPVITPDGSKVMTPRGTREGSLYTDSVVEYSTRTGRALASVAPPVSSAFPGTLCVPLWTNPSGEQVITLCGHFQKYDHGHVTRITMHPPMNGTNPLTFGWQPGSP